MPTEIRQAMNLDQEQYKFAIGHFASGVVIVTALSSAGPVGLTCQSFFSVSLDPPMVALSPSRISVSWPRIQGHGQFCANILADNQHSLAAAFAVSGADKFRGLPWRRSAVTGSPILDGVLGWADCKIATVTEAGDHYIATALVVDVGVTGGQPLLYFRSTYGKVSGGL
jgi:3-hydroxy-9,10-secoandrosta-1,3,5(10)-triene-9,17-dione monooxygenase reductase component